MSSNRTWLSSVLFLDIVGYSRHSIENQIRVKDHFNSVITNSIDCLSDEDSVKLDTGDGIAICYLGDPEDILYLAIGLRNAFMRSAENCEMAYSVRSGINLGPVKIVEDINGQRNMIGDAINVAQRIMAFAQPDQLLVSRSYFDVVNAISENYEDMFNYIGMHEDKHVRKHAVYEVLNDANALKLIEAGPRHIIETTAPVVDLNQEHLESAQTHLAAYIGPMAKLLVERAAKQASSVNELYLLLAEEIDVAENRKAFLSMAGK
ncbi:adenylate/guanylate cyclase domain-containing protein [Sulfuriflexus sp.]|uniref:adenylate/guanylate cyclase domain-containing protein n=1 Tax=Sulfuriflexus sp. TaxID=2015443 RepID=UPI0028CF4970|nr:adenylate/guanylate cyclase domain-containing protein [Sulfuriflexus sp.]MDT8403366.1 adenylate/guanylate cyclase domain-containing protein [Sulfuriflexus sp.]